MGWFDAFFKPKPGRKGGLNLPSLDVRDIKLPAVFSGGQDGKYPQGGDLPNASLIYGIGAAVLFTASLYFLFTGGWLTAFLLLFPAGALLGFALYYLKHPS